MCSLPWRIRFLDPALTKKVQTVARAAGSWCGFCAAAESAECEEDLAALQRNDGQVVLVDAVLEALHANALGLECTWCDPERLQKQAQGLLAPAVPRGARLRVNLRVFDGT